MNILREVRRINKKSMPARIIVLLMFCVIFLTSTYAWFRSDRDVELKRLRGEVTSWDVAYYINEDEEQFLDQVVTFTIEQLYPGMPEREDLVHIYNVGKSSTNIKYELISIKVFGQDVLQTLKTSGEIKTTGTTTELFSKDTTYPFNIRYTYDKTKLVGKYEDDNTTPNAAATFKFSVNWPYEGQGTAEQKEAKDILDTRFGKQAYEYYSDSANDPTKAIEIQVKITSSMIHPSEETP